MAVVQPAVTGDPIVDSWSLQVTQALNAGALASGGVSGGFGSAGDAGRDGIDGLNTATLYLFRRHTSSTVPPGDITSDTTYEYSSGTLEDGNGNRGDPADADDAIDGWFRAIPEDTIQPGDSIWAISVNIAAAGNTENISATTWSAVTLLARPGDDAVTVFIEARSPDNDSADWVSLSNTSDASPNFKNDTAKVIGLVVKIYEAGVEVDQSVYTDSGTTYVWTKNGIDFTPNETQVTGTGKDMRVLLINEQDVADDNFNEVFTCVIDY